MKKWVYLLLLVFFLSKFNLVFRYHDTRWDESVFIGMGKYIFSNGEIGLWEPIRPIGLPLVLGLLWKLGLNPIFSIEFISIFFSVGCIWLVFLIGKNLFNEIIGFLSALILASTPLFYYFSSYGFTGIPSAFFGLLALYFLIKKNIFLTGIFSGIAFLFRFPQGILFAVFGYLVFRKNKDKLFEYCIGIFLSVTPYLIFNLFMYKDMFFPFFEAIPHQTNPVHSVLKGSFLSQAYNLFYYPLVLIKNNPVYLSGIFYFRSKKKILLPFLIFFVYFTAIINKQERFILAFLPYLSLMAGYSLYKLLSKKNKTITLTLLIFFIIPLATIAFQYTWRSSDVPEINSLYTFFRNKSGVVLTTLPNPVAYSDIKFIPFYNNVDEAVLIYEKEKNNIDYILYSDEFYPCFNDTCFKKRELLFESIKKNMMIFNLSYDQNYYVFER